MLRPGGVLVYSTCTFSRQENEEMTEWLIAEYPQMKLEKQVHIWPHLQRGEGHFAARFQKEGKFETPNPLKTPGLYGSKYAGKSRKQKEKKDVLTHLQQFLMETLTEDAYHAYWQRIVKGPLEAFGEHLYLIPDGAGNLGGLKVERAGLQLGRCKKNRFEPTHAFAMALSPAQVQRTFELPEPERYLRGEVINSSHIANGWVLVTVCGCSLGWGKSVQGLLKNHYPKGLRWQF